MAKKTEKQYIQELDEASENYEAGTPIMSDPEFDNLYDQFKKIYPNSEYFKNVGAKRKTEKKKTSKLKAVKHKILMGSLLKVNNIQEVKFWYEKYAESKKVAWSEKIDGLSISLYYEKGEFKQAITRGDGEEGDDVTHNVVLMNFPKKLKKPYTGDIRGEIVLRKKMFKKHFADKSNPRNVAAGISRRLDGEGSEHLDIYCYQIETTDDLNSEIKKLDYIKSLGLETPEYGVCSNLDEIQKVWQDYEDKKREAAEYELDGLCLFVNECSIQDELGVVDNRPRYARAYKFSPQSAVSTLEDVFWQVGRTGRVTPVAKITPVNVAGALITNVSLHNLAELKRKNISINGAITVERKGDVIPQITECTGGDKEVVAIKKCPSCSSTLVAEDIFLMCVNDHCPEQQIQSLLFWIKTLDIKGFGDKMVAKLYTDGLVKKVSDFYKLTVENISELERSGETLAKKLLAELESKKQVEAEIFIKALGIEDFGESASKLILEKYKFEEMFSLTEDQLLDIHGIGKETAKKVVAGLKEKRKEINELLKIITLKKKAEGILTGKSFCFSGFRDKNLETRIKEVGGSIADSVSKNTYCLIIKEDSGSSKVEKAKKNGTKVILLKDVESIFQ